MNQNFSVYNRELQIKIEILLYAGYIDLFSINNEIVIRLKKYDESKCSIQNDINLILGNINYIINVILDKYRPVFKCIQDSEYSICLILEGEYDNLQETIDSCYEKLKQNWKIIHNDKESEIQEQLEENENYSGDEIIVIKKYLDNALDIY